MDWSSSDLGFLVVLLLGLAFIGYALQRKAAGTGIALEVIRRQLAIFALACAGAVAAGTYLRHRYPEGLVQLVKGGSLPSVAVVGPDNLWPLLAGGLLLLACAILAIRAARRLQWEPPSTGDDL